MNEEQLHKEEVLNNKIREIDSKISLKQESYQARDLAVDHEIKNALLSKLKKKRRIR